MSPADERYAELISLIAQRLDERETPESSAKLDAHLLESDEACALFIDLADLHACLSWETGPFDGLASKAISSADRSAVLTDQTAAKPVHLSFLGRAMSSLSRPVVSSLTVAGVLFAAYIVAVSWSMLEERRAGQWWPETERGRQATAGAVVAEVTDSQGVKWSGSASALESAPSEIRSAQPLAIASGVVELQLQQGTTLTVVSPARWSVVDGNRVKLHVGRLVAHVPEKAIGFTVETPTSKIVDLGTEFGVTVDEQGSTHARVFQGEVRLHATALPDAVAAHAAPASRLTAGQAMQVGATGNITRIKPEFATTDEFIRSPMPTSAGAATPGGFEPPSAYSRAVLNTPGLVGYWRLGEDGLQRARDEIGANSSRPAGRSGGRYINFHQDDFRRPGAVAGQESYAVHFNGESYLQIDDQPSLEGDWSGLTLAAWIKPYLQQPFSRDELGLIAGKWAPDQQGRAYALFYHISGRPQLAIADGQGGEIGMRGAGTAWIGPKEFRFVVGAWDRASGEIRLYVDGELDGARLKNPPPIKLNPAPSMPLSIGAQSADNSHYFAGVIDEVSVYRRALTGDEIEQLYQLATAHGES